MLNDEVRMFISGIGYFILLFCLVQWWAFFQIMLTFLFFLVFLICMKGRETNCNYFMAIEKIHEAG